MKDLKNNCFILSKKPYIYFLNLFQDEQIKEKTLKKKN